MTKTMMDVNIITGERTVRDWTQQEISIHEKSMVDNIKANEQREVLKELNDIDMQSIRSLREGDTARLAGYEQRAVILRKKLVNK